MTIPAYPASLGSRRSTSRLRQATTRRVLAPQSVVVTPPPGRLAPNLQRDRLDSVGLAGRSGTAQAHYLGLSGLGGTRWTSRDAAHLTTDQKVGGSSPSKRANQMRRSEAVPGPGGRLLRVPDLADFYRVF